MLSARRRAQFGLVSGSAVFLIAISILLAGSYDRYTTPSGAPGTPAATFRLPDLAGTPVSLASMNGDIVVLCFAPGPDSKPCERNMQRMAQLGQRYVSNRAVKFISIFSGTDDLSAQQQRSIATLADTAGPKCITLLDPTHRVSQRYGVDKTPTYIVIDSSGLIRYNGGVDDPSPDAPFAATSFTSMIDLLLAERPANGRSTPAVLSNIK